MTTASIALVYTLLASYAMAGLFIGALARARRSSHTQINFEQQYYPRAADLIRNLGTPGDHFVVNGAGQMVMRQLPHHSELKELDMPEWFGAPIIPRHYFDQS